MPSNADIEQRWIEAWNALYEIMGETTEEHWNAPWLLPDGRVVDVNACQGWLQTSAYEGWLLRVEPGWVQGRRGAVASRWRGGETDAP